MLQTNKMPSFNGKSAGSTATLNCPIGQTFHRLLVAYSGLTLAQMTEIRVVINGEVVQRYLSGTQLDVFNQFEGRAAANGVLVVDFERYNLRTRRSQEVTAIGTGVKDRNLDPRPVTTLTLEIDIDPLAAGPIVLTAKAKQSAASPVGVIKYMRQFTHNADAAGDKEISDFPKGDIINRIFFGGHTANVYTNLKGERENRSFFDRTAAENEVEQVDGVRTPQADYLVFDPTEEGYGAEGLATGNVSDLRWTLGVTNAGSIPASVEYIGPLAA